MQVAPARGDLDHRGLAHRLARDEEARRRDALDLEGPAPRAAQLLRQALGRLVIVAAEAVAREIGFPGERLAARARLAGGDAKERGEPLGFLAHAARLGVAE